MRLFLFVFIWMIVSCQEETSSTAGDQHVASSARPPLTTIRWIDSAKNFGKINEGQKLALSFRFINTGTKPLVIESVRPSCGCTIANYPKEPIAPGAEGEITGEFDSHAREGLQHKELIVKTNTPEAEQGITFEVVVVKAAKE